MLSFYGLYLEEHHHFHDDDPSVALGEDIHYVRAIPPRSRLIFLSHPKKGEKILNRDTGFKEIDWKN